MHLCRKAIRLYKDQFLSPGSHPHSFPSCLKSSRKSQQGIIHLSGVKRTERNFFSVLMNKSVSPDTLTGWAAGLEKGGQVPRRGCWMWQLSPQEQSWCFGQALPSVGFSKGLLPTTLPTAPQLLSAGINSWPSPQPWVEVVKFLQPFFHPGERWWSWVGSSCGQGGIPNLAAPIFRFFSWTWDSCPNSEKSRLLTYLPFLLKKGIFSAHVHRQNPERPSQSNNIKENPQIFSV